MLSSATGKVETRPFQLNDLAQVYQLEQLSFKDAYPWWLLTELARKNPDTFIVARFNDRIVGYAVVDKWDDDAPYHLVSIAVHPEARRHGVATVMLTELETKLEPRKRLRLEVRESNSAAEQFYAKHNFIRTGNIPGYYADGETAIVMEKLTVGG